MVLKNVRLQHFVLCAIFVVTNFESGDAAHWLLTYTAKNVDLILSRTRQQ